MEQCICAWTHQGSTRPLIRPIHWGPTLNDILPKLTNGYLMTTINAMSGYHSLKPQPKFLIFKQTCMTIQQVTVHKTTVWSDNSGSHFPVKNNEIIKGLPNVFSTADDILIVGNVDGRNHEWTLKQVIQICHQENLKLNTNKCHFGCTKIPFLVRQYPKIECSST